MRLLSQTLKVGLAAFLAVFSSGLAQLYTAPAAAAAPKDQVTFCHYSGNNTWHTITAAPEVVFNSGHDTHQDGKDIIPDFEYVKQGQTVAFPGLNYDATGKATLANNCTPVPPTVLTPCVAWTSVHATNLNPNGWTLNTGASFVEGGLELSVAGSWATSTATRSLTGELKNLGTDITFTPGTQYLGLHVTTSKGVLVYEQEPTYGGKWWSESDFGVASGMGYATFDTLENIVAANPGVTLTSLAILYTNPQAAVTTVTSVKIGCVEYTFDYERQPSVCTVSDQHYTSEWDEWAPAAGGNASYAFTDQGLRLDTPEANDYVYGLMNAGTTPLADVDAMSYDTYRLAESGGYAGTLPSYILYVDLNGTAVANGGTYLFYEPYYNAPPAVEEGTWQTWDALHNGDAKWYISGTGQKLRTWESIVAEYPDAVVLEYGFNQGQSNAETFAYVQNIEFDYATTTFGAPAPVAAPSTAEYLHTVCVAQSNTTDRLQIRVTNTADGTQAGVDYTITLTPEIGAAISQTVTVTDGATRTVTFTTLPAGEYDITIVASDGTTFEPKTVTISACTAIPGTGGGTISDTAASTTAGGAVLPASIPATGSVEKHNPLLIVSAALLAYGATFFLYNRRELV